MARLSAPLCVLLGFVLATGLGVGVITSRSGPGPVYTPVAVCR
jgi:hypothetical protein